MGIGQPPGSFLLYFFFQEIEFKNSGTLTGPDPFFNSVTKNIFNRRNTHPLIHSKLRFILSTGPTFKQKEQVVQNYEKQQKRTVKQMYHLFLERN